MKTKKIKSFVAFIISLGIMVSGLPVMAAEVTEIYIPTSWESIATHNYVASGTKVLDLSGLPVSAATSISGMTTITVPGALEELQIIGSSSKTFEKLNIITEPRTSGLKLIIKDLKLETSGEGINITQGGGDATLHLIGDNNIKSTGNTAIAVTAGKTLTITAADSTGKLTASGAGGASGIGGGADQPVGNIEITGGTIIAAGSGDGAGIGGAQRSGNRASNIVGDIKISGGIITAIGGTGKAAGIGAGYMNTVKSITLSGGSITATAGGSGGAGIGGTEEGEVGDITISGDAINATGKGAGAGIGGGGQNGAVQNISVSGGIITAIGGASGGAGIGGAGSTTGSSNSVTISGGTITKAEGGYKAAGIGGGASGAPGPIVIQGLDTIIEEAIGGAAGGAGIGFGDTATGDSKVNITINGATIKRAVGGSEAAGIGGGGQRGLGSITITDAKIGTVQGGSGAAGIGTGAIGADNGTIVISGGEIFSVTGGENGAGIGGGNSRGMTSIIIKEGAMIETAKGGLGAAGIGSGPNGDPGTISISGKSSVYAIGGGTAINDIGGGLNRNTNGSVTVDDSYVLLGNDLVRALTGTNTRVHFTFYKQDGAVKTLMPTTSTDVKCKSDSNFDLNYKTKIDGTLTALLPEKTTASGYYIQLRQDNKVWDTRKSHGLIPVTAKTPKLTLKNSAGVPIKDVDGNDKKYDEIVDVVFGMLYSIPTATFTTPAGSENIVAPYSLSNTSYGLDLTSIKAIPDVTVTSIVTTIDLKKIDGEYANFDLTKPVKVIVYKFHAASASYVYDVALSNSFSTSTCVAVNNTTKKLTITYPTLMKGSAAQNIKVSVLIPTVLNATVGSGGSASNTKVAGYLAKHVTTSTPLDKIKTVVTNTTIEATVKIRDEFGIEVATEALIIDDNSEDKNIDLVYKDLIGIK